MTHPLVAIVGGDTLLAKEIRERLEDLQPKPRVQIISAGSETAKKSVDEEEVDEAGDIVMVPLSVENLKGVGAAFLAGSPASSRRAMKLIHPEELAVIDLTGALEDRVDARLRAPFAEPTGGHLPESRVNIVAHPAAIALTMFLTRVTQAASIRQSIVNIFEPASERGQRGLTELQQQTVSILSFKKLQTDVFDAQLGFNMLARYGEEALEPLEGIEQRIERHLASLLAAWSGVPMPSLRLIQAPVFHGHSFSVWLEFEDDVDLQKLSRTLEASGIDVRPEEPPSNAGIAGQSGLSLGAIAADRNHPRAAWFWLVADNLRLSAENAVAIAGSLA